ncbi:MAG TPA: VWA domain-containing protein [Pyrinomonadaceae bacterium]|jgi:VWFA-related protein|nr:VWA domain-containing protein [Pyrinomonadaceae bacterium]
MFAHRNLLWLIDFVLLACLLTAGPIVFAQDSQRPKSQSPDDVVRVFTELVQTDVMVFDKQGHFIKDLTRDNFVLKIDGQVRSIQFFEQINSGTSNEEIQLAAARGSEINTGGPNPTKVVPLDRGRIVLFYVDDFHLDLGGFAACKKIISDFIDKDMGQNDQVAIASASGQVGFLQQLTSDRNVLHAAVKRLTPRSYSVLDSDRPVMTEYEAMLIDNNDNEVFNYFVDETLRLMGRETGRDMAAAIVRGRTQSMLSQGAVLNTNTLSGLEGLVRNAKDLPGRKVLFVLSNGFLVHNRRSDATTRLQRITAAAAKTGVVIYSIDSRGLSTGQSDISLQRPPDLDGRLARSSHGELSATQDGLNALARDTGGRASFNTNDFRPGIAGAMKETAVYYLLAWKPDTNTQKGGRFRNIQISVIGRPELTVRVRKGFFDVAPTSPVTTAEVKKPLTPEEEAKNILTKLQNAIVAPYPQTALPLTLGVNYYDSAENGPVLSASVQIPGEFLLFGLRNEKTQAVVDLSGVYYDDKGLAKANFLERIVTTFRSPEEAVGYHGDITYSHLAKLPPGLYQVRVAARDDKSGRTGSTNGWITIPDLSDRKLSMSSLLLGERTKAMMRNVSSPSDVGSVMLSPSHRFRSDSTLRLLVFAYNTTVSPTEHKADLAVQVQVIRDDQPVLTTPLRQISTENLPDMARIPYAADIPLTDFRPGRYLLQVTIIDRTSKQSATRDTHFDIY